MATVPLWMLAADRTLNGMAITVRTTVAIALGVIGVAVLARPSPAGRVAGVVTILVGSASWGAGSVLSQRLSSTIGRLRHADGGVLLVLIVAAGEWSTFAGLATYAFVNPLVAVRWGGWLLDEHLTLSTLPGAAILVVSVVLAIRARPRIRAWRVGCDRGRI